MMNLNGALDMNTNTNPSVCNGVLNLNDALDMNTNTNPSEPSSDLYLEMTKLEDTYLKHIKY
jgi:hypothetical protein